MPLGPARFSPAEEQAFQRFKADQGADLHLCHRAASLVKWALVAIATSSPAALLAGVCSLYGLLMAFMPRRIPTRLLYPLEAVIDVVTPICASSLFHDLYPPASSPGVSALYAVAATAASSGMLALACLAKTSPLTFRWQLPVVVIVGCSLLAHTPDACGSTTLQHGFSIINCLARLLLALCVPAYTDFCPVGGIAELLAVGPGADRSAAEAAAAAAMCASYQAASMLLGCAALACSLYATERRQRNAFLTVASAATAAGSDGRRLLAAVPAGASQHAGHGSAAADTVHQCPLGIIHRFMFE